MKRHLPAILICALVLLAAWAKDLRDQGIQTERERGFVEDIQRLTRRADSLALRYVAAKAEADSVGKIARAAVARRGRVVASSDSVLARVDSVLSVATDSTTHRDSASAFPLLADLRTAMLRERLSSDSAIASLSSLVEAKDRALSASDSLIASLQERIVVDGKLIATLTRIAHPPLWKKAVRAGQWIVVGAVVGLIAK